MLGVDAAAQDWDARRRLGYMPEHSCLPMGMTARDLVVHMGELRGLPRRVAVLRASEVLFQVGLEEERSRLIRTFSVGMRQRTNLAQAIVHSPELVILDEPTNGLDPAGRDEMLTLVRRLSADLGIAVVMSSHVLEDVSRTCDAVVVLREGKLAALAHDRPRARDPRPTCACASPVTRTRSSPRSRRAGLAVSPRGSTCWCAAAIATGDARGDPRRGGRARASACASCTAAGPTLEDALIGAME